MADLSWSSLKTGWRSIACFSLTMTNRSSWCQRWRQKCLNTLIHQLLSSLILLPSFTSSRCTSPTLSGLDSSWGARSMWWLGTIGIMASRRAQLTLTYLTMTLKQFLNSCWKIWGLKARSGALGGLSEEHALLTWQATTQSTSHSSLLTDL